MSFERPKVKKNTRYVFRYLNVNFNHNSNKKESLNQLSSE
jgi:hypothetical protein